jgi:hypothetical protein
LDWLTSPVARLAKPAAFVLGRRTRLAQAARRNDGRTERRLGFDRRILNTSWQLT